ncbi:hypothetical protein [Pseudoneobacillus rhizosphaerae]|uniref:Uncharacterized protein n=1 Tax=Pseudoneobacillus rhizosphaerae TaxID=2880968 RepID=A0A9C7L8X0_9BACI|nr:hypothetical protein [Pseudoneobacillus rhizosphaerae]CAG9606572.1 hypothetical protein NEOCIP111885_00260 [Pseudoneobacillus rhizosphaerae]
MAFISKIGYPELIKGIVEVDNQLGGMTTQLLMIGKVTQENYLWKSGAAQGGLDKILESWAFNKERLTYLLTNS